MAAAAAVGATVIAIFHHREITNHRNHRDANIKVTVVFVGITTFMARARKIVAIRAIFRRKIQKTESGREH